jgi:hypothetical protein
MRNFPYSPYHHFDWKPVGTKLYFFGNKSAGRHVKRRSCVRALYVDGCITKYGFNVSPFSTPKCMDHSFIMRHCGGNLKEALREKVSGMATNREYQEMVKTMEEDKS